MPRPAICKVLVIGDEASAAPWRKKACDLVGQLFQAAQPGGLLSRAYVMTDGTLINAYANAGADYGKALIITGAFYLYSSYKIIQKGIEKTATLAASIPALGKSILFQNIHTYSTVQEVYRKPVFKTSGRNTVWGFDMVEYPDIANTYAVRFYLVKNPDDMTAHPNSSVMAFTGAATINGLPVNLVPWAGGVSRSIDVAVFLTNGGYYCYTCVRYWAGDVDSHQIVMTRFDKKNAFLSVATWTEATLFQEEPTGPPDSSFLIFIQHWQCQGLKGFFHGAVFKLRYAGAPALENARYEFTVSANRRSLAAPEIETMRFPDAILFPTVDATPENGAGYGKRFDYGMAYLSNVLEYKDRLFVTLAVWQYDGSVPLTTAEPDIAHMPDYNGRYKYHSVVFSLKTGALLATYHDTGIGEWIDTGSGLYGLTVGQVEFSEAGAAIVNVTWHVNVFPCRFNKDDANLIEKTPGSKIGYDGPQAMAVAFVSGGCWYTANMWSKSCATHLMQKYT